MNDMTTTIEPKSDQLNADSLIAGPITITVTRVTISPGAEQPVAISYEGDGGKSYMACKSMRRVLVSIWGPDAAAYTGRSMTLYRDPDVTWGGMAVGGIRISHMSDITEPVVLALTATKKARKPFRVLPLVVERPAPKPDPAVAAKAAADEMVAFVDKIETAADLALFEASESANARRKRLAERFPDLARDVDAAVMGARNRTAPKAAAPVADDDIPF